MSSATFFKQVGTPTKARARVFKTPRVKTLKGPNPEGSKTPNIQPPKGPKKPKVQTPRIQTP